jgi:hypothetical protein
MADLLDLCSLRMGSEREPKFKIAEHGGGQNPCGGSPRQTRRKSGWCRARLSLPLMRLAPIAAVASLAQFMR